MEMTYHSVDKHQTSSEFAHKDDEDDHDANTNEHVPTKFPPPPLWMENTTCYSPLNHQFLLSSTSNIGDNNSNVNQNEMVVHATDYDIAPEDVLKFSLLCLSSIFTVFLNLMFIIVLMKVKSGNLITRWIRTQPRYMFISIGINDLLMGLLVFILSLYPSLYKCWPFGKGLCQVQVQYWYCNINSKK